MSGAEFLHGSYGLRDKAVPLLVVSDSDHLVSHERTPVDEIARQYCVMTTTYAKGILFANEYGERYSKY